MANIMQLYKLYLCFRLWWYKHMKEFAFHFSLSLSSFFFLFLSFLFVRWNKSNLTETLQLEIPNISTFSMDIALFYLCSFIRMLRMEPRNSSLSAILRYQRSRTDWLILNTNSQKDIRRSYSDLLYTISRLKNTRRRDVTSYNCIIRGMYLYKNEIYEYNRLSSKRYSFMLYLWTFRH